MKPNINNQDVSIEEVNKVIKQSEGEDEEGDGETSEEYTNLSYNNLSEEDAKEELDSMIVPGSEDEEEDDEEESIPTKINANQKINTNQNHPQVMKPINMNLLQFQCSNCDFKSFINLEDEKINPLNEKVKCFACRKKKSIRKRIFNVTINGIADYKQKEKIIDNNIDEEDLTEL